MPSLARTEEIHAIACRKIKLIHALTTYSLRRARLSRSVREPVASFCFDLLKKSGKDSQWKTYNHDLHGFLFPEKNTNGHYQVDQIQMEAIDDTLNFMDRHLKHCN